jgi:hypothetical protein
MFETISLEIVTIKWKGQLTKRFIKNGEGKQAKWKYGRFSNFNVHNIPINIKTTCMTYTIVPKVCHLKKTNPIVYSHVVHAKTTIFSFRLFALSVFDKTFR